MKRIYYLFHTVRHLKAIQLINRCKRKFFTPKLIECADVSVRKPIGTWFAAELLKSTHIKNEVYCFLNHDGGVGNWNDSQQEKLWLYNLHYFDDLNAQGYLERTEMHRSLMSKWIDENPPLQGNGWEPYPQSLRIVNWIKWFISGNAAQVNWQSSLWQQVAVLEQDIEYHLLGNHLLANAKALVFSGCYFEGNDAERWLEKGLSIIDKELKEQILKDGGNFELSPMYHNTILADLLDLINLGNVYQHPPLKTRLSGWKSLAGKMLIWMNTMTHPDGDISFFNDSAKGISATADKVNRYAKKMGVTVQELACKPIVHLKESGYIKLQNADQTALLDVAKVGPDYIPGHAHADTLSFEWNVGKQRVFVNSGTSVYGLSEERLRQRKTAAHNTVVVDGQDSSEVWSGFRVAKRAYPSKPVIHSNDNSVVVACSHNGYLRLPGKVTHSRIWEMYEGGLIITDKLSGDYDNAQASYHLHPDIEIKEDNGSFTLKLPCGKVYELLLNGAGVEVKESTWHPEFGISMASNTLILHFKQSEISLNIIRVN